MKPISFKSFLVDTLKINSLTDAQLTLVSVAFDGAAPDPYDPLCAELFGPIDAVPERAARVIAWLKGARIGGSWLSALWLLYRALTADLSALAPGEHGFGVIVAPDLRAAGQVLRYVTGAAEHPQIAPLVTAKGKGSITFTRPDGKTAVIECLPASRGGSATRSRSYFGALLDEACFFYDEDYVVNDVEIYKSINPRLTIPASKMLVVSTVNLESGLLWDLYRKNWSAPSGALAIVAPTKLMRAGDPQIEDLIATEFDRDETNANREFACVPLSGASSAFFDSAAINAAVGDPTTAPIKGATVGAGADLGFVHDSSALAIVQRVKVGTGSDMYHVSALVERTPEKGNPLKPSEVGAQFCSAAKGFNAREILADSHYLESFKEHSSIPVQRLSATKSDAYVHFRDALHEGRVLLPDNPRLLTQLRQVVAKPTAGGKLAISSPRKPGGGHGDLVSALVAAVWAVKNASNIYAPGSGFADKARKFTAFIERESMWGGSSQWPFGRRR